MISLVQVNDVDVAECEGLFTPLAYGFGCADLLEEVVAEAECFAYGDLCEVCS